MDLALEKTNIDINSLLISWGLMPGEYHNGVIKTTKFGLFNMWFAFLLFSWESIKWIILMFYTENSQIAIYLGEWHQYYGPKLVVDIAAASETLNSIALISLYYFSLRNQKKMLFWLDFMDFNSETRFFYKMNLRESESKKFTKQLALMWFILKQINYFLDLFSFATFLISFLLFKHDHYVYYLISIFSFSISVYYLANHWFGLTLILYQVNNIIIS